MLAQRLHRISLRSAFGSCVFKNMFEVEMGLHKKYLWPTSVTMGAYILIGWLVGGPDMYEDSHRNDFFFEIL